VKLNVNGENNRLRERPKDLPARAARYANPGAKTTISAAAGPSVNCRSCLRDMVEGWKAQSILTPATRMVETLTPEWTEYELLDSGQGRKLERFGEFVLVRPEAQAKWPPSLPAQRWQAAHGEFAKSKGQPGTWEFRAPTPARWPMRRKNLSFWVQPAPSGHVGVFPDQACHWDRIAQVIKQAARPTKALCLFGHTGLATLSAAAAGAEVTHVDASSKAVALARENQNLSGLSARPIRWMVEDARTFVRREVRRGNRYEALLLDPPRFGRGPDGEIWKLDDSLPELLSLCAGLLSTSPLFVLLNVYATTLTEGRTEKEAERLRVRLQKMLGHFDTTISAGELTLEDRARHRIVASVFACAIWDRLTGS
jgi:23S rRNA (cytosine1962-C5)-methyltransferase